MTILNLMLSSALVLQGAVGEKADKLFYGRLASEKGRGDIHEETVRAFATHFDDAEYADEKGEKHRGGFWQGEYWGRNILSHIVYARYSEKPEEIEFVRRQCHRLIDNFQRPDGYLGTYADADHVFETWNLWGRNYTMWALAEAYDLTGDRELVDAAAKMAEFLQEQLKRLNVNIRNTGCFCGVPSMCALKPLVMIHQRTGNLAAKQLADMIVSEIDRADGDRPNIIANAFSDKPIHEWYPKSEDWAKGCETMILCEGLVAYGRAYNVPRTIEAAKRMFAKLEQYELNGIGSVGFHDKLVGAHALGSTINECCDIIHWMRLAKTLYEVTHDTHYLDRWEVTFYNAFMGAVYRDGVWGAHDVRSHGTRHLPGVYESGMKYHFCCIVNGPRAFGDWIFSSVEAVSLDEYNVNFYNDSVYRTNGVELVIHGGYPFSGTASVKVRTPRQITLSFRQPGQAKRLVRIFAAGESEFKLPFVSQPRIDRWQVSNCTSVTPEYFHDMFEMPMHNKEMAGYLRKQGGFRVWYGPLLLAKSNLAGDNDATVFGDIGIDESWQVSLRQVPPTGSVAKYELTFSKNGEVKRVNASDFESSADFDDWRNSFSIWF